MDESLSSSHNGSTDRMVKNIFNSIHQQPCSSSSLSTDQMLLNIQKSSQLPASPIHSSSSSDVSLWCHRVERKRATERLQQYLLMLRQQHHSETSSQDEEYQPSLRGIEEGRHLLPNPDWRADLV